MSIQNKIEQKQTQKIIISNKLVQSLNILNLGRQELENKLEIEYESNPALEVKIEKNEIDWEEYIKNDIKTHRVDRNETVFTDTSDYDFENMTVDRDTIYDKLHAQINIMKISNKHKGICNYLIDSLDKDGYLREENDIISKKLKVSKSKVEECIEIVQSLEPTGICARNLKECIILQLRQRGIFDDVLEKMIKENLNAIANSNIKILSSTYKIKKDDVISYIELIKSLNPKPVEACSDDTIVYAYPDVVVELEEGRYIAKPYDEKKVRIGINEYYKNLFINTDDKEVKLFLKEKLNSAKKIMDDVYERNSTIVKIANAIIELQYGFFESNAQLKPMTLNDISDIVGCHVSTVSRGVNDKYMLTSKGLLEFKHFFSNSYELDNGNVISSSEIKKCIKEIIDNEEKRKPLSDKKIEDILKEKGYDVARRTISKYREELGFLNSSKRKIL
ncbi:RNA polymerase factor sigma-54 [Peptostreptococcus faecalis]|uniref:RNA polymerase factor sigma-54 n=1 Tax=Peptostreptococcus faecalis TaxID=2045015 RepID=UPI000C7E642F|nr:RNA polymerase factor sigma-54 [Peptostreptococcus faecalis]